MAKVSPARPPCKTFYLDLIKCGWDCDWEYTRSAWECLGVLGSVGSACECLGVVAHPTLLPRFSGQDFLGVFGSAWECLGVLGSSCTSDSFAQIIGTRLLGSACECTKSAWECLEVLGSSCTSDSFAQILGTRLLGSAWDFNPTL